MNMLTRLRTGARLASLLAAVAVLLAPSPAHADEDWYKLQFLQPPYLGPGITGKYIPNRTLPGHLGAGPAPRGPAFNSQAVTLHSWLPSSAFGTPARFSDCTGYTSPAGREYAIICSSIGTHFVEITDPDNPVMVEFVDGPDSFWRDVEVKNGYCYTVSEGGGGVQVIDIRNIDAETNRVRFVANRTPHGYTTTHTIITCPDTPYLYICGSNINSPQSVAVLSLDDPENPAFAGQWQEPTARYTHECYVVLYTSGPFAGREIIYSFCISSTQRRIDVLDATDKSNIFRVSTATYPGARGVHQGWMTSDNRYMYVDDELDDATDPSVTRIMDMSDPANPTLVGSFSTGVRATDHNQYVRGNLLFQSNYQSGVHVWDITDPLNPIRVAYFDSYPDGDNIQTNGNWGNYPFFPSGNFIISDMQRGLFVLSLSPNIVFSFPSTRPTHVLPNRPTPVSIAVSAIGSPVDPPSVVLRASIDGGPYQDVPMSSSDGRLFTAALPAVPCQHWIRYYFAASNQNGATFTSPPNAPFADTYAVSSYDTAITRYAHVANFAGQWTTGLASDTATAGAWEVGVARPTLAQPGDDHSPTFDGACWLTGPTPGPTPDSFDVDGGFTTLYSPIINLSAADPAFTRFGYWRWYSNGLGDAPHSDVFTFSMSNDNGATWTPIEILGPDGPGTEGGWIYHEFRIADFLPLSAAMKLRFVAEDAGEDSLVEAAIDDILIFSVDCGDPCPSDWNASGLIDSQDFFDFLSAFFNQSADFNHDTFTNSRDFFDFISAFFAGC